MHLVIKNLSPEDFKKYNKGGITCPWFEKHKKKRGGGCVSLVFFSDSVWELMSRWALSNIYRNFGWDWMISGSDWKFPTSCLSTNIRGINYPCFLGPVLISVHAPRPLERSQKKYCIPHKQVDVVCKTI